MLAGRRRHERFALAQRCTGAQRLTLDVAGVGTTVRVDVMVADSRPVIIDGSVRHRVTLLIQEASAASTDDVAAVVA